MIRAAEICKKYNIGLSSLCEFLKSQGCSIDSSPNSKVEDEFLELIEQEFSSHGQVKEKSMRLESVSGQAALRKNIWEMKANERKKLALPSFFLGIITDYATLISPCFQSCKQVEIYDPYISSEESFNNLFMLIALIRSQALKDVAIILHTCSDKEIPEEWIRGQLNDFSKNTSKKTAFQFKLFPANEFRKRKIRVDNQFTIELPMTLDIFGTTSGDTPPSSTELKENIYITCHN